MHKPSRKVGAPLEDHERERILEAHRKDPSKTFTQLQDELGFDRGTISRVVRRQREAPAPAPELPSPPDDAQWSAALLEFLTKHKQPIPEQYRALFGITGQLSAPQSIPTEGPIVYSKQKFRRIAYVSDVHLPSEDRVSVKVVLDALADLKLDAVILGGDIFDCYEISDYSKDAGRITTLQDEFDGGRYFLDAIDQLCPNVTYLEGNHENRLVRLIGKNPGLYKLRSLDFPRAANLPAHWRYLPSQTHFHIGKLAFLHGDVKGASNGTQYPAATVYRRLKTSCLFGHYHRTDVYYERQYDGTLKGGFCNGHLSDLAQVRYVVNPNWQQSFTIVEMSEDNEIFSVHPYLIINGRAVVHGKEYSL